MTCFARITTPSSSYKKLEAGQNSRLSPVYDRYYHVYQLTLIFDLEVWFEMKMERLEQSSHEQEAMEGYCGRVTKNSYVLCSENPGEHAWTC
jgi:hypothetical protein